MKNSNFKKNTIIVTFGSVISILLPLITMPIVTRLYKPEDIGIYSLYLALASIISIISTGKYEIAIILIKGKRNLLGLYKILINLIIIALILTLISLFLFQELELYPNWLRNNNSTKISFILSIFLLSLWQICTYGLIRHTSFKKLTTLNILNTAILALLQVLFFYIFGPSINSLATALNLSLLLVIMLCYSKIDFNYLEPCKARDLLIAKKHSNLPKYIMPSHVISALSLNGILFFTSYLYGNNYLGFLSLAMKVLSGPVLVIGSSISNVFKNEAILQIKSKGDFKSLFLKTLLSLSGIAIAPSVILSFYGDFIFSTIFGEKWFYSGYLACYLMPMYYFMFISIPLWSSFIISENPKLDLLFNFLLFFFGAAALFAGNILGLRFEKTILYYSLTLCAVYILSIIIAFHYSKGIAKT